MINDLYTMTVVQQDLAARRRHAAIEREVRALRRQQRAARPGLLDRLTAWVDGEPLLQRRPVVAGGATEECATC